MENMDWLWISAVALVSVFILVLCCVFFKGYTCCPCRRKRPYIPDDVEGYRSPNDVLPRTHSVPRSYPRPSAPPPQPPLRLPLPTVHVEIDAVSPSPYNFRGVASASDHVQIKNGIPELDLHQLRVWEAKKVTQMFLKQSRGRYRRVRVITGRGLHSVDGIPRIKPEIEMLLSDDGYTFKEMNKGGCLEVNL